MSGSVRRRCDDHDMSRDTSQISGDRRLWLSEPCPSCGAHSGLRCQTSRHSGKPTRWLHAARGWRQRSCPTCKTQPGELCRTPTGRRAAQPHTARLSPARRELLAAGMGGARAVGCVGRAGSLLRRRRQPRQHLSRHARERRRRAARLLEQRRRCAARGARRSDLGPLRTVSWPAAHHRAADVGRAGAVDPARRQARQPQVRRDPVYSQADRDGHDRVASDQRAARHVATGGGNRHIQRGSGGLGNLAHVRALWYSVGGGAASGGALLLKALPAGRIPRPAASAVRPRRSERAQAVRTLPRPDAQRRAT